MLPVDLSATFDYEPVAVSSYFVHFLFFACPGERGEDFTIPTSEGFYKVYSERAGQYVICTPYSAVHTSPQQYVKGLALFGASSLYGILLEELGLT